MSAVRNDVGPARSKYDRVKCTECGYTSAVVNMQAHRDHTGHYRFRFTRDIESMPVVRVRERAAR